MSDIIVDAARCVLSHGAREIPCIIGKSGSTAGSVKREGDGATPLGVWPFRVALLRPDRVPTLPSLALPWRWLRLDDGWSTTPPMQPITARSVIRVIFRQNVMAGR